MLSKNAKRNMEEWTQQTAYVLKLLHKRKGILE
jgi:hypothetical protein